VQHLHHINMDYQGVADYPLHPIADVSSPIYLLPNLLLINHTRTIEHCICRKRSRYPGTGAGNSTQRFSGYRFIFPNYMSKTFYPR
jgi:hypothetical protein